MNDDIKLGMKLSELKRNYGFKNIVAFLKGETNNCFEFDNLKPLYDAYGYEKVNELILQIAEEPANE